jgi:hypothetical protein
MNAARWGPFKKASALDRPDSNKTSSENDVAGVRVEGSIARSNLLVNWAYWRLARKRRAMESAVTIGLDLGKSVFQVHGVDAGGAVVVQRRLTRGKLLAFFAK